MIGIKIVNASVSLLAMTVTIGGCTSGGKSFDSPEAASSALIEALSPMNDAKITEVLGSKGVDLLRTGEAEADQRDVDRFVEAFRTKHEFVEVDPNTIFVEVGPNGWPAPIPLVRTGSGWRFDTAAGADELLSRRIGRNELDLMKACHAIVDAQREYAAMGASGTTGVFADRFVSDPGTRNGLYWPTGEGESPSPLGPYLSEAGVEPRSAGEPPRRSFSGYHFKLLRSQGRFAPGGVMDYMKDGRLVNGFALVAWPIEYGESGVMTFMISNAGVLFERDLGPQTAKKVAAITTFDPTPDWNVVPQDWE